MNRNRMTRRVFYLLPIVLTLLGCNLLSHLDSLPNISPTPATPATPTAIPPTSTPACRILCDVDMERYKYEISCETGPATLAGRLVKNATYGASGITMTTVQIDQQLTYTDTLHIYTITGAIAVDHQTQKLSYAISASGGAIGDQPSTCQEGELPPLTPMPTGTAAAPDATQPAPGPTVNPGVLSLAAPQAVLDIWQELGQKYVIYVQKAAGFQEFQDLNGKNLYIEIIDLGMEEALQDASAFTKAGNLKMDFSLQNNDIYKTQFREQTNNIAWVTPAIAERFGFPADPDLQRLEFTSGEAEQAAPTAALTAAPPAPPTQTAGPTQLVVSHSPNPAIWETGGPSGFTYTCSYKTTVQAVGGDVQIQGFQAYFLNNGQWEPSTSNNSQPWSVQDFAGWYSCPGGLIQAGNSCSDPNNWNGQNNPVVQTIKWVFFGVRSTGERVEGEAAIECRP